MAAQRLQIGVPLGRCATLLRDLAFEKPRLTTSGSQCGIVLPHDRAHNGELRAPVVGQHGDESQSVLGFGHTKQRYDAPLIADRGREHGREFRHWQCWNVGEPDASPIADSRARRSGHGVLPPSDAAARPMTARKGAGMYKPSMSTMPARITGPTTNDARSAPDDDPSAAPAGSP